MVALPIDLELSAQKGKQRLPIDDGHWTSPCGIE